MEFVDIPPALPLVQSGKLKLLAVLSARRNPEFPNVPSVAETVPGYDASSWQGFFARAGTPKPIIEKLNAALAADFKRPETAERFKALGIVAQSDTPDEFRRHRAPVRRRRQGEWRMEACNSSPLPIRHPLFARRIVLI